MNDAFSSEFESFRKSVGSIGFAFRVESTKKHEVLEKLTICYEFFDNSVGGSIESVRKAIGDPLVLSKFLLDNYNELLNKIKKINENVTQHALAIANIKVKIKSVEKLAYDTSFVVEDIAQYLRQDRLEITGVIANEDCRAEAIAKSVQYVIGVPL